MKYRTIVADPPWPIGDFPEWGDGEGTIAVPYPTMSLLSIEALPVGSLAVLEAHLYLWTTAGYLPAAYNVARAWGFEPMYPLVWCKAPRGTGLGGKFVSNVEFFLFCRERSGAVAITSYLADAAQLLGMTTADVNRAMGTSDMAGWWLSRLPHRARVPTYEQWLQLTSLLRLDNRFDEDVWAVNAQRNDTRRCDTRWFTWPRGKHSQKPEHFYDLVEQYSPGSYVELFSRRHRMGWDVWGNESANCHVRTRGMTGQQARRMYLQAERITPHWSLSGRMVWLAAWIAFAGLGVLVCGLVGVLGYWLFLLGQNVVRSGSSW